MRGRRVSKKSRKLDVVLEAVRYTEQMSRLNCARGYKRVGYVWSDKLIFDRNNLVEMLKSKKRVVCGHPAEIHGDFEVYGRLQYEGGGEHGIFTCDVSSNKSKDDLGLPLF